MSDKEVIKGNLAPTVIDSKLKTDTKYRLVVGSVSRDAGGELWDRVSFEVMLLCPSHVTPDTMRTQRIACVNINWFSMEQGLSKRYWLVTSSLNPMKDNVPLRAGKLKMEAESEEEQMAQLTNFVACLVLNHERLLLSYA